MLNIAITVITYDFLKLITECGYTQWKKCKR